MTIFDASEVRAFAAEMRSASNINTTLRPVVTKGALNIKKGWNDSFRGSSHFKGVTGSVDFDVKAGNLAIEAEIGPNRDRYPGLAGKPKARPAAPLAGIATFGGANGGGGSVADPQDHLDAEEAGFVRALGDVLNRLLP